MDYPMQDPTGMPSVREPHRRDEVDMKFQIHCMEKEAYSSVLRAFIAQSDLLSWGKEGLITDLRRELNVTDTEHGELLVKINSDESIKMIREWRKSAPSAQESLSNKVTNPGIAPTSGGSAPQKKMKTSHASVSRSQKYVSHGQPCSATLPAQFRDNQPAGDLAVFSSGQSMKTVSHNIQEPSNSKGRVLVKSHSKKGFHAPDLGNPKKRSDVIEIRATDKLIHEVESVIYGRKIPDLVQIEKAKSILREHERTILEALAKLADVSDGDDSPKQMEQHYSHEELLGNGRGMAAHSDFHGQAGRFHGYPSGSFVQTHSVRARIPSHDVRDDDDDETP